MASSALPDLAALEAAAKLEPVLAPQAPRRTRGEAPLTIPLDGPGAVRDDDVVTLTLGDDSAAIMTVAEFRARFVRETTRGPGAVGNAFVVPDSIPLEPAGVTRGGTESVLKLFGIERVTLPAGVDDLWSRTKPDDFASWKQYASRALIGFAGAATAWGICRWREQSYLEYRSDADQDEREGMLELDTGKELAIVKCLPADEPIADPKQALLIFIHGTASSTRGSFAELWKEHAPIIAALKDQYTKLYAWEHRSLTASPVDNALRLVKCLPDGATLDLVSHSRGGLIGELLARAQTTQANGDQVPFGPDALSAFDEAGHPDAKALRELSELLQHKAVRVRHFVRVACPARGTILASERLDRYLGAISFAIRWGFGLVGNPIVEGIDLFIKQVATTRADSRILPGLEAQVPGSMLTRVLNDSSAKTDADLHVIAGDADVSLKHPVHALMVMLSNAFYLQANDFVVQTAAMSGGTPRSAQAWRFATSGGAVSHFNYFRNEDSARKVRAALAGDDSDFDRVQVDAHEVRGATLGTQLCRKPPQERLKEIDDGKPARPLVLVLPGIMGSELSIAGATAPIWFTVDKMVWGGIRELSADSAQPIAASGLLPDSYARLLEYLSGRFHPVAVPYDWRRSLTDAGALLAPVLAKALDVATKFRQPVHIIAHSMGGLVVRAMTRNDKGNALWKRLTDGGGRLLMLGVPNRGSLAPASVLTTRDIFVGGIALIDVRTSYREIARIAAGFQGLLELLPSGDWAKQCCNRGSLWQAETWRAIAQADNRVATPDPALLEQARVHAEPDTAADDLKRLQDDTRILYVAGVADETPSRILEVDEPAAGPGEGPFGSGGSARVVFEYTTAGDGRVTYESGVLNDARTWVASAAHGDLADASDAFEAYADLLDNGLTRKLPTIAERRRSRGDARAAASGAVEPARLARLSTFTPAQIRSAIVSGHVPVTRPPRETKPLTMAIVHGNLEYARFPVLFGHYLDEHVSSAGDRIDGKLSGQFGLLLSTRLFRGDAGEFAFLGSARDPNQSHPADSAEPVSAQVELGQLSGDRRDYPEGLRFGGAIAIGLGRWGELTSEKLTKAVQRAVLRMAVDRSHYSGKSASEPQRLRLSSLLIGTGTRSISVRESVAAIVRGVKYAADQLVEQNLDDEVEISHLEFVELYEDSAHEAAHALNSLLDASALKGWLRADAGNRFEVETRSGGRRRLFWEPDGDVFQRLSVQRELDGRITVRYVSDRARSELFSVSAPAPLLAGMVERAASSADPNIGSLLFELLLPTPLKERFADFRDTELELDDEMAAIPWEVLRDTIGPADGFTRAEPLSVRARLVRRRIRKDTGDVRRLAGGNGALVIGDPSLEGTAGFAQLPAAAKEATAVEAILKASGFAPTLLLHEPGNRIFSAILIGQYNILHIAGHGTYETSPDAGGKAQSHAGIVLSDNARFTGDDVERIRRVPELVFVNCCYLARDAGPALGAAPANPSTPIAGGSKPAAFAASVGTRFIDIGAKAVVVAGWTVNDQEAARFAETFYESMLAGESFARSVHAARARIYQGNPDGTTWGAYQCYGDPEFRLHIRAPIRPQQPFVSPRELAQEISNRAANITANTKQRYLKLIDDAMRSAQTTGWNDAPEVLTAHGIFLARAGETEQAVAKLSRALREAPQRLDIETLELYASMILREALARTDAPDTADAKRLVRRAKAVFEHIDEMRGSAGALTDGAARTDQATAAINLLRGSIALRAARIYLRCANRELAGAELIEALAFYVKALQILQGRVLAGTGSSLELQNDPKLASTSAGSDVRRESSQAYALAAGLLSGVLLKRAAARVGKPGSRRRPDPKPKLNAKALFVTEKQQLAGEIALDALLDLLDREAKQLIAQLQNVDYILRDFWDRSALAELHLSRAVFNPASLVPKKKADDRITEAALEIENSYRDAIGCGPNVFEIDSIHHRFALAQAAYAEAGRGTSEAKFVEVVTGIYETLQRELAGG